MRKKIVNGVVRDTVVNVLLENSDYTAGELKHLAEKALKQKGYNYKFTERTYLNLKKELSPNIGPTELDKPWTVGSCVKANIPGDMIPLLLAEQKRGLKAKEARLSNSRWDFTIKGKKLSERELEDFTQHLAERAILTIRQGQWLAKLYPVLIGSALKQYPNNPLIQANSIIVKAKLYAHREQVAEILNSASYPDTSDIDSHFDDLSQERMSLDIYEYSGLVEYYEKRKVKNERTHSSKVRG